jgi:hypothetical protein
VPAHQLGGKNECATVAEEAARVALASGVLRECLTLAVSRAGVRSTEGTRKRSLWASA